VINTRKGGRRNTRKGDWVLPEERFQGLKRLRTKTVTWSCNIRNIGMRHGSGKGGKHVKNAKRMRKSAFRALTSGSNGSCEQSNRSLQDFLKVIDTFKTFQDDQVMV